MSVKFKAVPKAQPGVAGGGTPKYYASIIRSEKVDTRQFAEDIAEMNLLSTTAVYAVLEAFFKRGNHYLSKGCILDLSQFGTFIPYISSTGVDTAEEVNAGTINSFYVNYRPGKLQRKQMAIVEFQKVANGITIEEQL